ncbi:hypothetical protein B0H67DRAFT_580628, partial [Lasiosphaeris hirsuta]
MDRVVRIKACVAALTGVAVSTPLSVGRATVIGSLADTSIGLALEALFLARVHVSLPPWSPMIYHRELYVREKVYVAVGGDRMM